MEKPTKRHSAPKQNLSDLKIIPIGGLGEIGRNMTVFEHKDNIVIIDCGILFPDKDHIGIDLILPDFKSLKQKRKNIHSLLITHGHEDHIGGIPFLVQEFPHILIYAPELAMEIIKLKLQNYKINFPKKNMHVIKKNTQIPICPSFKAEFIEVSHSIKDSYAIALTTPVGKILHTGDFKVELDKQERSNFDFQRFAQLGQEGIKVLLSDSTNIEKKSEDTSEKEILQNIHDIMKNASGRVIISTFASHINRVLKIIEYAKDLDKRVIIMGRSMENNFEISKKLGYIKNTDHTVVKTQSIKHYPDNKVVAITTGTQGETLSVLTRLSQDTSLNLKLKPTDTIIVSASVIPGNEKPFFKVLNNLYQKGCPIFYSRNADVHVSGHGAEDSLMLMLKLTQPEFFIPVHGEKRHQILHTKLAQKMGLHPAHTIIMNNGDIASVSQDKVKITGKIPLNQLFVQDKTMGNFSDIINEKKLFIENGLIVIIISIMKNLGTASWHLELLYQGISYQKKIHPGLKKIIADILEKTYEENSSDIDIPLLDNVVKKSVLTYLQKTKKTPIIKTKIFELNPKKQEENND